MPIVLIAGLVVSCGGSGSEAQPEGKAATAAEWFEDVTERSRVDFIHVAGTNYFMPDQVGSGVALLDFNNDGLLDLYLVQNGGPESTAHNRLFQQQPDHTFRDVSAGSGVDVVGRGMGAIAGDFNNDGLPDLVVTEYGATRLFQNLGNGRFDEVTSSSGVENPRWALAASFLDFDRDGWLDLVIGNYLDYDPTQICYDAHGRQDFCAPQAFPKTVTRLWRNATRIPGESPRFEDHTESSGLAAVPGVAMGIIAADFDGDGWVDIFCADDGHPNRLFINQRNGRFVDQALQRGVGLNAMGRTAANMGVAYGDFDGNGLGDVFVTHLTEEFHSLFRQDQPGFFIDDIARAGLHEQAWRGTGFGTVAADFDLDGDMDIAFVNGLIRRATPGHTPVAPGVSEWWARYAQRAQIFENNGNGRFVDVSPKQNGFCALAMVGRSLALGDLDNDGLPDLVVGNVGGPARIYRNVAPRRGRGIKLRLIDPAAGGRDAIGAKVVLLGPQRRLWGVLQPATSFASSHEPALHFGLASGETITRADVQWPDGTSESFPDCGSEPVVILKKGSGATLSASVP